MKTTDAITQADLDRSFLLIALLQVTRDAAEYLNDHGEPARQRGARAGGIVSVLNHISELQLELHYAIEGATRDSAGETE